MTDVMTAEELESVDVPGKWTELVRGQLSVREPPSTYHGKISATVLLLIGVFARQQGLGDVFGQDTGFRIASEPDTVRAPDVAFLSRDRAALVQRRGYASIVPNLVVEVLSPDDRPAEVLERVADWLAVGVDLAWIVDPDRRQVRVHRSNGSVAVVSDEDYIDAESVLPGLRFAVAEVFA